MTLKIIVPPHPLIAHWLTILRSEVTPKPIYSTGLEQLGRWLTYEALRDWLPHREDEIQTSNGITKGTVIENRVPLIAIANLPAGIHLWHGARELLPNADLFLDCIPNNNDKNAGFLIFVDQISTGDLLLKYLENLKEQKINFNRIRIITALTSNPGLQNLGKSMPNLTIYSACIDPELNKEGCIKPGIGNPMKRINTRITT